jgi:tripartite-type tricarboxylate transporter receptor subunit TctC
MSRPYARVLSRRWPATAEALARLAGRAKTPRPHALCLAFGCVALLALSPAAGAQWPERTVKFIVTFPPGSANDAAARIFADQLSRRWGKPVVVENKAGAEGTIGAAAFVAAQDDHTLLYTVSSTVSTAPLLVDSIAYDSERDLVPIASTTTIVLTLAVNAALPVRTIDELIRELKANPGEHAWASGPGLLRYVFAAFLKRHELRMNYIPYRDAAQPQADLGEGRIQALLTSLTASSAPVQAGKARFLAVVNPLRAALLPELPTVRELGFSELEIDGHAGIFGNRTMAEPLRQRIAADIGAVGREVALRSKLEAGGHIVLAGPAEELAATIERQRKWVVELKALVNLRDAP